MKKKRKKMPVKSRLRALSRVCALVCALTVALAVPMVAGASSFDVLDISEYVTKEYSGDSIHVEFKNLLYDAKTRLYINDTLYATEVSDEFYWWNDSFLNSTRFRVSGILLGESESGLPYAIPLNDIKEGAELTFTFNLGLEIYLTEITSLSTPRVVIYQYGSGGEFLSSRNIYLDYADTKYESGTGYNYSGDWNTSVSVTTDSSADYIYFEFMIPNSVMAGGDVNIELMYGSVSMVVDYSVFEENSQTLNKINDKLDSVNNSIDQGFDDMGGKLDGVQDSINQGFDEVGGKLDNIQSDINTGFDNVTGAINGAGADTSGMDNGMAQLGGQLGDLGDVEDQLGGLIMDKVEVPDLILTNDQGSALALLVSCLNLAYVDLTDYQVMFAAVLFFGIVGVLLFGRRNL